MEAENKFVTAEIKIRTLNANKYKAAFNISQPASHIHLSFWHQPSEPNEKEILSLDIIILPHSLASHLI